MGTVFLSYSRRDAATAAGLEHALHELGVETWRDVSRIEADWSREIATALASSRLCCLIWSEHAVASGWVRNEWNTARALGIPIVVVALSGLDVLPVPLRNVHVVEGADPGARAAQVAGRLKAGVARYDYSLIPPGSTVPFLPNPAFTGRRRELLDAYLAVVGELNKMGRSVVGFVGLPGVGKTQLAIEFAYRFGFAFDHVLWIQGAEPLTWRQQLAAVVRHAFGADVPADDHDPALIEAIRAVMTSSRALLVVDNVSDARVLHREGLLGVGTQETLVTLGASVIYTTRRAVPVPFGEVIDLGAVDEAAAYEILTEGRAPGDADGVHARAICSVLAGLPLPLVLANGFLRTYLDISYGAYSQALQARTASTLDSSGLTPEDLATRHDAVISATLEGHLASLGNPRSREVLLVLALHPESDIVSPRHLEVLVADVVPRELLSPVMAALGELTALRLVDRLPSASIRIHPFIRAFVLGAAGEDERAAQRQQCAVNVGNLYGQARRLLDECGQRGVVEVVSDLDTAAAWGREHSQEQQWLGGLARVLRRESRRATLSGNDALGRDLAQQLLWRCHQAGLSDMVRMLGTIVEQTRQPRLIPVRIVPVDDPALIQDARETMQRSGEPWRNITFAYSGDRFVTWGWSEGAGWSLAALQPTSKLRGREHSYAFGLWALPAADAVCIVDSDGWYTHFDADSGSVLAQQPLMPGDLARRSFTLRAAALSMDGQVLVVACDDREAYGEDWSLGLEKAQALLLLFEAPIGQAVDPIVVALGKGWLDAVGVDEDASLAAVPGAANGTVDVYEFRTGRRVTLSGYTSDFEASYPNQLILSRRLGVVVAQIGDDVAVWDLESTQLRHVHRGGFMFAALALHMRAGELVAANSKLGIIRWDLRTGEVRRRYRAVGTDCVAVDDKRGVLLSAGNGGLVERWDLTSADAQPEGFHTAAVRKVAACGDRPRFSLSAHELLGWSGGDPSLTEAVNQELQVYIDEAGRVSESSNHMSYGLAISDFAYNDDSELLLTVGADGSWAISNPHSYGRESNRWSGRWGVPLVGCGFVGSAQAVMVDRVGGVLVLDLQAEKLHVHQSELSNVGAAAFASHKPLVLLGTGDGRVRLLDLDSNTAIWGMDHGIDQQARFKYRTWNGAGEALFVAGISAGGERVLLSFLDDGPIVVDLPSGTTTVLRGHDALVFAGALSENGQIALSGDQDGRVIAWDARSGVPLTAVELDAPITAAAIADASYYIGDERGRVFQARLLPTAAW
jgi:WD40 repeat protein